MRWIKKNIIVLLLNGPLAIYLFYLLISIPFNVNAQRSPVDLRDSTDVNKNIIIIRCDCTCDTIPKVDTLPI